MEENIITNYIKYVSNSIDKMFKILLENEYDNQIVKVFINKYINVRYYNDSIYKKDKDFVTKMSKELNNLAKELIVENLELSELIKNVCALFGYILYFDDCITCNSISKVIDTLFEDKIVTINFSNVKKEEFKILINEFVDKKEKFLNLFNTKEFILIEKRIKSHIFLVDIDQDCQISKLYSDFAINKAFNTGVIAEDKIYLMYIMLLGKILKEMISLDFSNNYIVKFPETLLNKSKKATKFLKAIDNEILKNKISFLFTYKIYKENKNVINKFINEGYKVAIEMDETFDNDFETLILFSYVLVYEYLNYYDIIMDSRNTIKTTIISL